MYVGGGGQQQDGWSAGKRQGRQRRGKSIKEPKDADKTRERRIACKAEKAHALSRAEHTEKSHGSLHIALVLHHECRYLEP